MKRVLSLLCIMLFLLGTAACSNDTSATLNDGGLNISKKLRVKDLSIQDFNVETTKTYINGKKMYVTTIANNSAYDVIGAEIRYGIKEEVSDEQLSLFHDFAKKHEEYIEDTPLSKITLIGRSEKLLKSKEGEDSLVLFNGIGSYFWYDLPNDEQFALMEEKELQIAILGKDKVLYVAYYDFKEQSWALDQFTKDLSVWPENELSAKVSRPESDYCVLISDVDSDNISFNVYDATKESFQTYVSLMKEQGFTLDVYESDTYYSADTENEESIQVSYYKDTNIMHVSAY